MTAINYFWHGSSVSRMEILSFTSAFRNQHQPVVWSFEKEIKNLPSFVLLKDATELLARDTFEYYLNILRLPIANISDIIRYILLKKIGGIYSDTDMVFIKNLNEISHDEYFCSTFEYDFGELANGCLMKLTANSAVANYLNDECNKRIKDIEQSEIENVPFCYLGPFVIQECAAKFHIPILPYDVINPISWPMVHKIIAYEKIDWTFMIKKALRIFFPKKEKRGYNITRNTIAVHLYNEIWRSKSINKSSKLHPYCLYERLYRKFVNRRTIQ